MGDLSAELTTAADGGYAPQLSMGTTLTDGLADLVDCTPHRVLVIASTRCVEQVTGVAALLRSGAELYSQTRSNPTSGDALRLSSAIERHRPHTVVAVGGGSVLDLAKAGRLLRSSHVKLDRGLRGEPDALRTDPPFLVAVPTTAGTGAEITPFATLYHRRLKVSLDLSRVRPDLAVLDGALVHRCPRNHLVPALLDALCHAVESWWSTAATPLSRSHATTAINGLTSSVHVGANRSDPAPWSSARHSQISEKDSHQLLLSSAMAGVAIAQTRTTGGHAFAYHLTSAYGIPHGFACALSLSWLASHYQAAKGHGVSDGPVATIRDLLDRAIVDTLVDPPNLSALALDTYIDAGLGVSSRIATHPVPLGREEAASWIGQDGRLTRTGSAQASRALPAPSPRMVAMTAR